MVEDAKCDKDNSQSKPGLDISGWVFNNMSFLLGHSRLPHDGLRVAWITGFDRGKPACQK
jgi:hypothetical protein